MPAAATIASHVAQSTARRSAVPVPIAEAPRSRRCRGRGVSVPADGSALFARVLPDGPILRELRSPGDLAVLLPAEEAVVARAVESRRREFAAGRACARAALADLGYTDPGPILPDERRAPIWPPAVVGSITHCTGLAAAVVASADVWWAVGIDAEPAESLPEDIIGLVLNPSELAAVARLPDLGVPWERVAFSAKESVYKVWYPLCRSWLGFEDAELDLSPDGAFSVRLRPDDVGPLPRTLSGQWAVADGFVVTAVILRATSVGSARSDTSTPNERENA